MNLLIRQMNNDDNNGRSGLNVFNVLIIYPGLCSSYSLQLYWYCKIYGRTEFSNLI